MDEETCQKLEKIDQKVTNKLIKHKDNISERDMNSLLKEARRQQEEILRQRNVEKLRQNEALKARLIEKRNLKVNYLFQDPYFKSMAGKAILRMSLVYFINFTHSLNALIYTNYITHRLYKVEFIITYDLNMNV